MPDRNRDAKESQPSSGDSPSDKGGADPSGQSPAEREAQQSTDKSTTSRPRGTTEDPDRTL